jgi:hypothetical protein
VYPVNTYRESLYQYASVNVVQGDHIRLENVRLSYDVPVRGLLAAHVRQMSAFVFIQQLPYVWLKNSQRQDPYFNQRLRDGLQWSFGLNFTL